MLVHDFDGTCMPLEYSTGPFRDVPTEERFADFLKQLQRKTQVYVFSNVKIINNPSKYGLSKKI